MDKAAEIEKAAKQDIHEARGQESQITTEGVTAHGATPEEGVNAIHIDVVPGHTVFQMMMRPMWSSFTIHISE